MCSVLFEQKKSTLGEEMYEIYVTRNSCSHILFKMWRLQRPYGQPIHPTTSQPFPVTQLQVLYTLPSSRITLITL